MQLNWNKHNWNGINTIVTLKHNLNDLQIQTFFTGHPWGYIITKVDCVCDRSSNMVIVSRLFPITITEPQFVTVHPTSPLLHVCSWYPSPNCCSRPFRLRYSRQWNSLISHSIISCIRDFKDKQLMGCCMLVRRHARVWAVWSMRLACHILMASLGCISQIVI
jgi:hypothetical protein